MDQLREMNHKLAKVMFKYLTTEIWKLIIAHSIGKKLKLFVFSDMNISNLLNHEYASLNSPNASIVDSSESRSSQSPMSIAFLLTPTSERSPASSTQRTTRPRIPLSRQEIELALEKTKKLNADCISEEIALKKAKKKVGNDRYIQKLKKDPERYENWKKKLGIFS